ncbi:amidohydrolase [Paraclostridium sordellii]|uniref:amidohydrolase n=1 Tax=Paraclostridium sordellii TaxID=1505 RepID=UPI0005E09F11|nr:amidohydrolase [Paeniclostridium sordellii]CEO29697.1 amidohydrolase [[Clostridium] sordellii] [Paeniclostridium sordellii]CEP46550.1 amidohydrolase [[Clostridium] sordellii] [Paeniclostridium sordellii]CEQ13020.1 amidohydrolase [[Clostridium] sordellii] [Paeniclostridium sordellii]
MLLIKNGKILTMTGKNLHNGCVLIKDKKIIEINETIEETKLMTVIDAKGAWVMPGIIEAHCHIGLSEEGIRFEGDDINESTSPITGHLRAIDAINPLDQAFKDAIAGGITSVMTGQGSANVCGGKFLFMKTSGKCIDDMIVKDEAAMKVAFGENPKRVYSSKQTTPSTRMATAAILREALYKAINYKNKKEEVLQKGDYFEVDLKQECFMDVLDKKIPLKAHAHRADDILTAIRLAKEFNLDMTLDHCTEGHLIPEYIKKSGFSAIVGPSLTNRSKVELKNRTFKTAGVLNKYGVDVAITTDHPVVPIQYLPICAGFAAKEGLGIEEALKAITINPAKICGVEDMVGSIEVGKDADIAIFTGNPMEVFSETLYTIIDGNIVYSKE